MQCTLANFNQNVDLEHFVLYLWLRGFLDNLRVSNLDISEHSWAQECIQIWDSKIVSETSEPQVQPIWIWSISGAKLAVTSKWQLLSDLPSKYELLRRWKQNFGTKRVVWMYSQRKILQKKIAVAVVVTIFRVNGPKWAVLPVFRALGCPNVGFTFLIFFIIS